MEYDMQELKRKIEILKRMDLKVAVPPAMQNVTTYDGETSVKVEYIHIPSLISSLEFIIMQKEREVEDIKRATRILLPIIKPQPRAEEE